MKNQFRLLIAFLAFTQNIKAQSVSSFTGPTDQEIAILIKEARRKAPDISKRIELISERFLGMPYKLGPLGEGPKGEYDRDPLIRFDCADCTTFVETIMALALAENDGGFADSLNKIRYRNGVISYVTRNHFTSADWIPANIEAGFIKDTTAQVAANELQRVEKTISKKNWYDAKKLDDLSGFDNLSLGKKESLVKKWRKQGRRMKDEKISAPYVPTAFLITNADKIPSGSIFNLIREDQPDKPDLVSHQGFIIQRPKGTYVRHAAWGKAVEDVPLAEYLKKYETSSWKLLGMNLNAVVESESK
ncbi:MAG: DUF1460 domain-containing protein [Elusimicrobia bacterium]|nr:DUF1460 domain-containing protein [Elusimicrobiota bacterium]